MSAEGESAVTLSRDENVYLQQLAVLIVFLFDEV